MSGLTPRYREDHFDTKSAPAGADVVSVAMVAVVM